jgi:NitT/TauT family transport system substrate-binding protein
MNMMHWLRLTAVAVGVVAAIPVAVAQPEKKSVSIGVGGKPLLYYLPLTIAEEKGFFKEEGLDVTINDFRGGGQALQALIGGSVDAVTGAYEHTIRMQAKGQDVRAVLELGRFPGIVLAVKKQHADKVNKPGDLKGMKIGVSAPGSSTHNFLNFLLARDGLRPEDVSVITVGTGASAIAAMKQGELDGFSNLELSVAQLEREGAIKVLVDTRTEQGTKALFGANNPAAVLYMKADFYEKNPKTGQALTNALWKALKWIEKSTPEEITAAVPAAYHVGDKELYTQGVKLAQPGYSRDGIVTREGMDAAMKLLSFDKEVMDAKVDVSKTFDDRFVKNVPKATN